MSRELSHKIERSPVSLFDSSWDVGSWDDFGQSLRYMEKRMREMDRQFEQMFKHFMRLHPTDSSFRDRDSAFDRDAFGLRDSSLRLRDSDSAFGLRDKDSSLRLRDTDSAFGLHERDSAFGLRDKFFDDDDLPALPSSSTRSSKAQLARQSSWDVEEGYPVETDKEGKRTLRLQFDVRQFQPAEITVKTMDNRLEVHAKHDEGDDQHKVYREYHRVMTLPPSVDVQTLASTFSPEGVLSIEAPLPPKEPSAPLEAPRPKAVPIAIQHQRSEPADDK